MLGKLDHSSITDHNGPRPSVSRISSTMNDPRNGWVHLAKLRVLCPPCATSTTTTRRRTAATTTGSARVCSGCSFAGLIGRGGTHMWLGIDVGGKVLQGLGSCLFPDLAVHMATGPAAQYSAVCPDGLRVLSRQDLSRLGCAPARLCSSHGHRTGGA